MHFNLWFNTGSELLATVSSRVNRLETFTFVVFANQDLNQISSNPPQQQDDGSVAKTTDWDPKDLKVKSKCASSFRLNFRLAWALRKPPIGKPSPALTFIQHGEDRGFTNGHADQHSGEQADPQQRGADTSRQGQRGSPQCLFSWCAPMCLPEGKEQKSLWKSAHKINYSSPPFLIEIAQLFFSCVPVFKEKPERHKFTLWTNSLENFSLKNKAGFELHRRGLKKSIWNH